MFGNMRRSTQQNRDDLNFGCTVFLGLCLFALLIGCVISAIAIFRAFQ
jgi:hypothetical protein